MKRLSKHISAFICALALAGVAPAVFAEPAESITQSITYNQPQVRVLHGQIEITVPGDEERNVTIYALTGQIIKSLNVAPGVTTVDLPKGYYIVKCDRISCRVVVK